MRQFFGLSGIKIAQPKSYDPNAAKIPLKMLRREMFDNDHVIKPDNYDKLYSICEILTMRPPEKRSEREKNTIVSLVSKMNVFNNKHLIREKLDLEEVSNFVKYERKEPGETLFKQGDKADTFYIVLKGTLQVQIPSPFTDHIFIPEPPKKELKNKKDTKKIGTLKSMVL